MKRADAARHRGRNSRLRLGSLWPSQREQTDPELPSPELLAKLFRSGLFDPKWYLETYRDVAEAGVDPVKHYFQGGGAQEGRRPNPCFDSLWYLRNYNDVLDAKVNPLTHYVLWGENEGRSPNPHFETRWYLKTYRDEIDSDGPLAHYLRHRASRRYSPNRVFDVAYYLRQNDDVAAAEIEPFEHFISTGFKESRNPSPNFDVRFYRQKYLRDDSRDPIAHYFEVGRAAGLPTRPNAIESQAEEIRRFTSKSRDFEELDLSITADLPARAKVIAFYLPQFHAFAENDRWWGKGFTEWTNIMRGTPRFSGHYQPRVPRDFGFYDLTNPAQLARQMEVAKRAGIHGFCFYYYNFNGKRLLERPIDDFLANRALDFPFCLMWANENWTRRWDGEESEVLMRQDYRADDAVRLVDDVARHFKDPRYIRIEGRPLFFVYRPDVIPNARLAVEEWRSLFLKRHGENPWIFMAQSFTNLDPGVFNLDGAVEFPPHKIIKGVPRARDDYTIFDDSFSANVYHYDDLVASSLAEEPPAYPLFKTVFPSWDNDARRQGHGVTVRDSTPAKYHQWLSAAIDYARRNPFREEAIVFVNAWNEWAEGAYLEPDVHFGAAYLNHTARAVVGVGSAREPRKVLLVGHDAFPSGSQMLLLNLAQTIKGQFGLDVRILLGSSGRLLETYQRAAQTHVAANAIEIEEVVTQLSQEGYRSAITNTVASGQVAGTLKAHECKVVSLVHELPGIIAQMGLTSHARALAQFSDEIIFAAAPVRDAFKSMVGDTQVPLTIRPQGSYQEIKRVEGARDDVRDELGLSSDSPIALAMGYGDLRKGVDLFCAAAQSVSARGRDITFVWVGDLDPAVKAWIAGPAAPPNVRFLGQRRDIARLLSAADVFVLTSREDPYPCAIMEALAVGLPVIAFDGGGGFVELLREDETLGKLVPHFDPIALGREIVETLEDPRNYSQMRMAERINLVAERFAFDDYAFELVQKLYPDTKRVSVVVPNYNYAHYLLERLTSIFAQNYPIFEIIVLDDRSKDDSVEQVQAIAAAAKRRIRIVANEVNSGNVFAQWAKGAAMARGDLIWIAEADDVADSHFLERMVRNFDDEEMLFAFSDSRAIDAEGRLQFSSYKAYYAKSGNDMLAADVVEDARDFASAYLGERNLILNVSSVLWRKDCLVRALRWGERELSNYRLAGDWFLYICACAVGGKVAYCAETLNSHRRHKSAVTSSVDSELHLGEIERVHAFFNSTFGESDSRKEVQEAYLEEVSEELGLHKLKATGTD